MFKSLLVWIRNNFGFSKTETNGFVVLIPLMVFLLFAPSLYSVIFSKGYKNSEKDKSKLDSILVLWNENAEPNNVNKKKYVPKRDLIIEPQFFNPNNADKDLLMTVGIPPYLAQRILNYRSVGGSFKVKDDLSKIYDFPDSIFQILKTFIQLPEKVIAKTDIKENSGEPVLVKPLITELKKETIVKVDINRAGVSDYESLRGIGPVYAKRILKYRSLLGGYIKVTQLAEVYGVTDSLVVSLKGWLTVQESFIPIKLKINIASFKQLVAHPYISYEQAGDILNTKSKYGKFKSNSDLKNLSLFSTRELEKLQSYLAY